MKIETNVSNNYRQFITNVMTMEKVGSITRRRLRNKCSEKTYERSYVECELSRVVDEQLHSLHFLHRQHKLCLLSSTCHRFDSLYRVDSIQTKYLLIIWCHCVLWSVRIFENKRNYKSKESIFELYFGVRKTIEKRWQWFVCWARTFPCQILTLSMWTLFGWAQLIL